MEISSRGNLYLQESGMNNHLFTNQRDRCDVVVYHAVSLVHLLASLISPYMPSTSEGILRQVSALLCLDEGERERGGGGGG